MDEIVFYYRLIELVILLIFNFVPYEPQSQKANKTECQSERLMPTFLECPITQLEQVFANKCASKQVYKQVQAG